MRLVISEALDVLPAWRSAACLREVANGHIVLVRSALQTLGFADELTSLTLAAIAEVGDTVMSARVAETGFERLHEAVPIELLVPLVNTLTGWLSPVSRRFAASLVRGGEAPSIFIAHRAWPRLMVPHDVAAAKAGEYGRYLGHLVSHNPHRDSWFSQPLNGINVWIAVGPVHAGNGLLIYPAVFSRELAREKSEVARSEPLGVPLTVEMRPGDMLLFLGDHLHSSELNVTPFTRYVVSFRLTVGEPVYAVGERMTPYHRVAAPSPS